MAHARACMMGLLFLTLAGGAIADPPPASPSDLSSIFGAFSPSDKAQSPSYGVGDGGYIQNIVALQGSSFINDAARTKNANTPGAAAVAFLEEHKAAFGVKSSRSGFTINSENTSGGTSVVKVQQTYDGIPVLGGQFSVSLDQNNDIKAILSDPLRDTRPFDQGYIRTSATLDVFAAEQDAVQAVIEEFGGGTYNVSAPEKVIYDPEIVGTAGEPRLAYRTQVRDLTDHSVAQDVFVDAHSGNILLQYSLLCTGTNRYIYDLENRINAVFPGIFVREEGDPPSGNQLADEGYDLLGDIWQFYNDEHGRDGMDDVGGKTKLSVRLNEANAFYVGSGHIIMGTEMQTDEIMAHEWTHGFTDFTSNLLYFRESGALNESMSDIWGELHDLANPKGIDDPPSTKGVTEDVPWRWQIGEGTVLGIIRNMKDPPLKGHPDRYSAYQNLPLRIDSGGVHINSGIANKLCYLLVDGTVNEPEGEFNEYIVNAMGEERVLDLFYRAQTAYLNPGSGYLDLYFALLASANDLNWQFLELENLVNACKAIEIFQLPNAKPLRHLRAQSEAGTTSITLTWKNPSYASLGTTIVRNDNRFPTTPNDGQVLVAGSFDESFIDTGRVPGQQYFYGAFNFPVFFGPETDFAQATAGEGLPTYATEEFTAGHDMSFTQIFYSPTGDLAAAFDSGRPSEYVTFHHYDTTVTKNVQQLPVRRINGVTLNLPDNEAQLLPEFYIDQPIFFFGYLMNEAFISANGYVTPADVITRHILTIDQNLRFPTVFNHWDIPRISFFFKDLIPASGGEVWTESLSDRVVITFVKVREKFASTFPPPENTFQVELFYSGHIRVTYLNLESQSFIAGLSDGRGIPIAPSDLGNSDPDPLGADLDQFPEEGALSIQPIATSIVAEGDLIAFRVEARSADIGSIAISASNMPSGAEFNTATNAFMWRPGAGDSGVYQPRFTATQGASVATQDALIIVNDLALAPSASNVTLAPVDFVEDDQEIIANYDYASPDLNGEGFTELFWYRNGFSVSALFNSTVVPPEATEIGDMFSFVVWPRDSRGLRGAPVYSDEIIVIANTKADINEDGVVNAIDVQIVINAVLGKGLGALNPDANIDGQVNSVDIQTVINKVLQ